MNPFKKKICFHLIKKKYFDFPNIINKNWKKCTFVEQEKTFLLQNYRNNFSTFRKEEYNKKNETEEIRKKINQRPFFLSWKCFLFNLFLAVPIFYLYILENEKKKRKVCKTTVDSIGKPLIGGNFTLVNQKGEIITNKSFKNKFCLIYFGFTYCPDICPQELEKQTIVIEKLKKKYGDIIVPIFISVDPKRDTVAQVNHYCKSFSPHLVGLTGTMELIKNVAKNFRVYFNENITNTASEDEGELNQYNYLIDHSIIHYLLNSEGEFVDFFGKNCTTNEMTEKIGDYLEKHLKQKNERCLATV